MHDLIKLDIDTAKNEFKRWAAAWFLDVDLEKIYSDESTQDESEKSSKILVKGVIEALQSGRLLVSDSGPDLTVLHYLHRSLNTADFVEEKDKITTVRYRMITLGDLQTNDKYQAHEIVAKQKSIIAAMTKVNPALIMNMLPKDAIIGMMIGGAFFS